MKVTADNLSDLEIKDAQLIFESVWQELEVELSPENLRFPKEIILLGGAPGAGKGTNTAFITKARGLTCSPIIISALLDSPEAKAVKDLGNMVGDREVVGLVLRRLLREEYQHGVILDGFPRTKVQVECLKLLVDKMHELRRRFYNTPLSIHFRHPTIHIMVLFVDELESVARQLKRGRETRAHNTEVMRTGIGRLWEDRPTDHDETLARRRYQTFKEQTWDALQSLKEIFHYHFINAQGPIEEVEQNILHELEYQSTLELDPRTVDRLRGVPVASEISVHARQELVKRLDSYELEMPSLFASVVSFIEKKMIPIVVRHAISGIAHINTEDPVLDDPLALAMLIDVFSERGYHAVVDIHRIDVPERFDVLTGAIECRVKKVYRVQIRFQGSEIRRG
jgi:adenylate kinase